MISRGAAEVPWDRSRAGSMVDGDRDGHGLSETG